MKRHTGILFTSALMLGGLVTINSASALSYESEQGLSFTLNPTIRITLSSDTMTINDLAPGSTSDSNIIKVTAESNAVAGYTLSSTVGNSTTYNTTNMVHTNGTNTFTNLSSNKATLANFDPSTWGYSYATCTTTECTNTPSWISGDITGTTNSGYNGLTLYSSSSPIKLINTTTPGSSAIQFKFGAKADTSQLAGTYSNVINFIGVGKIITTSYTINFNDPSGEATSMPASQTGTSTTGSVQISSTQPTRTNYLFKGWCTAQTSDDTCSGDTVQPGGMLGLHPGTGNLTPTVTRTLYAMWGETLTQKTIANSTTLQEVEACPSSLVTGQAYTLIDTRDNEQYVVAKLEDGRCWMLDNLRLDISISSIRDSLTESNTNADAASITSLKNGNRAAGDQYANGSYSNYSTGASYSVAKAYATNNNYVNPDSSKNLGNGSHKYGMYYNYCAASAGSYCYGNGLSEGTPATTDAEYDICPSGWRMPIGGKNNTDANSEPYQLAMALGLTPQDIGLTIIYVPGTPVVTSLSLPMSGSWYYNPRASSTPTQSSQGSASNFWTRTYLSTSYMCATYGSTGNVTIYTTGDRTNANTVRCIFDNQ